MVDLPALEPPLNTALIGWTILPQGIGSMQTWVSDLFDLPFSGASSRCLFGPPPRQPRVQQYAFVVDASAYVSPVEDDVPPVNLFESTLLGSQLRRDLDSSVCFAKAKGQIPPSRAAIQSCVQCADRLMPWVVGQTDIRVAGFDNEEGEVSLVLQSFGTQKRLTLEFSADGTRIAEFRTDAALRVVQAQYSANEAARVGEAADWLTSDQ